MIVERKPFAVYAITKHGIAIASRLLPQLSGADLFVSEKLFDSAPAGSVRLPLPMGPTLSETFTAYDCHIFIISVGAVVRMIAPLLKNKKVDPAVVCIDDAARFAICVLSGHVGRGNVFTERVAQALGAQSVVTTASDAIGTLTVDILGRDLGWTLDDLDRNVTRGCAAVVNAAKVLFVQETGEPDWWPAEKPLPDGVRYATSLEGVNPNEFEMLLIATDREIGLSHPAHWKKAVIYRPKSLVLGIGCDKGTAPDLVERGVLALLAKHGLSLKSVNELATIDVKKDEPALLALSEKYGWPLRTYPPEQLDVMPGILNPSETVKRHVGSRGVSEPAALLAAGVDELLVPKQIYTEPGAGRSMTLAVARRTFVKRPMEAGSL
ncbi:cobalt-precorrin 5A hydrolase [Nitrospira defluvii]|uniref:Cobalt-precorrin-5A hydrolase n=1 Tax=Nitrospira defluvii TaxID=330214 RepID=A0ABN7M303_9BACT|nr:cobalamin biosynthesis protein [Nitrospira defluvii]CAE6778084.1 Cobalt-precorrin-5A hydrolase [Nitrospira defluvii]